MNTYILIHNRLQVLESSVEALLAIWDHILCLLQQQILLLYVVNVLPWRKKIKYVQWNLVL